MKKLIIAMALAGAALSAQAWDLWDDFRAASIEDSRVIDRSDDRLITTSEGQSYALFFALAAGDRKTFAGLLDWTEKNLSSGDITKNLPAWLWGRDKTKPASRAWGILDTNNAADSDMWIAYTLLEAGRLWGVEDYTAKGRAMLELIRQEVRTVEGLGAVILPGHTGFEKDGMTKLNPSYYPLFILRRFALEDPFWKEVYDGSLRMLIRSAPSGFSPEWALFDRGGRLVPPKGEDYEIGSYNAIRTYLWAGMLSPLDPASPMLRRRFEPMTEATRALNFPPEETQVVTGDVSEPGPAYFGACLLELLGNTREAGRIRTVLSADPVNPDRYYGNVLTLYGLGFDAGQFAFDRDGRVILPASALAAAPEAPAASEPAPQASDGAAPDEGKPAQAAQAAPAPEAQNAPQPQQAQPVSQEAAK